MKKLLFLFLLCPLYLACDDDKKRSNPIEEVHQESSLPADTSSADTPQAEVIDEVATEKDGVQTEPSQKQPEIQEEQADTGLAGKYRQLNPDEAPGSCNCNCIEVSFNSPTELCIARDKIYINARYSRISLDKANVYFEEMLRDEETERDLPWNDFDKNTPVATVTRQPDGSLKLDWLGFAINGEIAVDYAIYGKKTLEGQYKKY